MSMLELRVEPTIDLTEIHQNLYNLLTKENSFQNDVALKLYAIVNTPALKEVYNQLDLVSVEFEILLDEKYAKLLDPIVPVLIDLTNNNEFLLWLIENGYGSYGVQFVYSQYELNTLAKSLRELSLAQIQLQVDAEYKESFFHFYDNRTFHPYTEIIDYKTSKRFFESVTYWLSPEPISKHIMTVFKMKEDGLYFNNLDLNQTEHQPNEEGFSLTDSSKKVDDDKFTQLSLSREDINHFDNIKAYRYTRDVAYSIQSQLEDYADVELNEIINKVQPFIVEGFQNYGLMDDKSNFYYVVLKVLDLLTHKDTKYLELETSEYLVEEYLEDILIGEVLNG